MGKAEGKVLQTWGRWGEVAAGAASVSWSRGGSGAAASSHGMWGLVDTVGKLAVTLHKIITCAGLQ